MNHRVHLGAQPSAREERFLEICIMPKLLQVGLTACIFLAVLAFGGMEPFLFAGVEIGAFILFGIVLWSRGSEESAGRLPWKGPALLLSYVIVQSFVLTPNGSVVRGQLLRLFTYLLVFCLTAYAAGSKPLRRRLVMALLGLGLFEALYGLVQYLGGWQQIFTYKKVFYIDRASGTYINPNHFAGFLELVLPLSFGLTLYLLDRGRRSSPMTRRESNRWSEREEVVPLLFYFFASLLLFVGILFSQSRMGIFSSSAALVGMVVLWVSSSWQRSVGLLVLVGFLLGASVLGLWIGIEPVVERYESVEGAYLHRLGIWKDTASIIKAHPLFGTGLGTFIDTYPQFQTTFLNRVVDHAHNDYLETTAELGILGVGLLFGLILIVLGKGISAFYRLQQKREKFLVLGCCGSILAILLHSLADFNLYIPANALVLAVILGLSHSLSDHRSENQPNRLHKTNAVHH